MYAFHENTRKESIFVTLTNYLTEYQGHWHEEIEVAHVVCGNIEIKVSDKVYKLTDGDSIIICPGDVHSYLGGRNPGKIAICLIKRSVVPEEWELFLKFYPENRVIKSGQILPDIRRINTTIKSVNGWSSVATKAAVYQLLLCLLNATPWRAHLRSQRLHVMNKIDRINSVLRFIEDNYNQDITLDDAAFVAGFSRFYFTRFFKESCGMTFNEYLSVYRVNQACILLMETAETATQIAYMTGFGSIKTFNRVFRIYMTESPIAYRKRMSGGKGETAHIK